MKIGQSLRTATDALRRHRLRSFLSAIGVTFGVGALVAMLAVAEGAQRELLDQIARLGTNTVMLRGRGAAEGLVGDARGVPSLGEVALLERRLPGLLRAAPLVEIPAVPIDAPVGRPPQVVGTVWEYFRIRGIGAVEGRVLARADRESAALVCVLGAEVARDLGPAGRIGGQLAVGGALLEVVGVLQSRGLPSEERRVVASRDIDRTVFVPFGVASLISSSVAPGRADEVSLAFEDAEAAARSGSGIRRVLGAESPERSFEYDVVVPSELLEQAGRAQTIMGIVLGAIALISLAVGGVGIMNIMLVSVSERVSEIGLRRAVGATAMDILVQFLTECLALTMLGALGGVALGAFGAQLVSDLAGWPTEVTQASVGLALLMALLVGVMSGLYPALKAARLSPITALRTP